MNLDLDFVIDFNYLEKIFEKYQIKNDCVAMKTQASEQKAYFCEHSQNQDKYIIGFFMLASADDQTPNSNLASVVISLNDSDGVIFPNSRALFPPFLRNIIPVPAECRLNVGGFIDTKHSSMKVNINRVIKAGKTLFINYFHTITQCTVLAYILYAEGKLREGIT